MESLSKAEVERYHRQLLLSEMGLEGQAKLKAAKVLVIGAGGLGSPCLLYLAGAGVGTIGILDHDTVERINLHRQVLLTLSRIDRATRRVRQRQSRDIRVYRQVRRNATLQTVRPPCWIVRHRRRRQRRMRVVDMVLR